MEMTNMPKNRRPTKIKYVSLRVRGRVFKVSRDSWEVIDLHARQNGFTVGYVVISLTAQLRKETQLMTKLKFNSRLYGVGEIKQVVGLLRAWMVERMVAT